MALATAADVCTCHDVREGAQGSWSYAILGGDCPACADRHYAYEMEEWAALEAVGPLHGPFTREAQADRDYIDRLSAEAENRKRDLDALYGAGESPF